MSNYADLKVWQKSIDLSVHIYDLSKELPDDEKFGLIPQMKRAVVSIASNIAEGHGRNSDKDFIKFLRIALGSLYELETQIEICIRLGYLDNSEVLNSRLLLTEISKMLNSLISYRNNNS